MKLTYPDAYYVTPDLTNKKGTQIAGTYTIVKGDELRKLAPKFGVSLKELIRANPQIKSKNPDLIYPGEIINIPVRKL